MYIWKFEKYFFIYLKNNLIYIIRLKLDVFIFLNVNKDMSIGNIYNIIWVSVNCYNRFGK